MELGPILHRNFYARSTEEVARDLLGKVLVHGRVAGIIVETEAYPGGDDRASHSSRGITNRTRVIFGEPGHAYVYFIYGMYECFNIVVDRAGTGGCVLVRALEPLDGIDLMRRRRPTAKGIEDLANGPGKLTLAMSITRSHYAADLTRGKLVVREQAQETRIEVVASPRIGITHNADRLLRYTIAGNRFVSK